MEKDYKITIALLSIGMAVQSVVLIKVIRSHNSLVEAVQKIYDFEEQKIYDSEFQKIVDNLNDN